MRHVIFRVENACYGLPLSSIREVVLPPATFSRVPRAPRAVVGVMNLRGRVVTVVELRELLELSEATSPLQKVVLLDRGRRDLGLLVTEVEGIESVEKVSPPPGEPSACVRGITRLRGLVVTILEPEGLDGAVAQLFGPK